MNVYIVEVAKRMAERGVEVDLFTRATSRTQPPCEELAPGVTVRHVAAGPLEELDKTELPRQMCAFTSGLLRTEAAHEPGHYDLIHSHYWLSGQAGHAARMRWGVPLVHSMHTLAKVKNAALAAGDTPEPLGRVLGEQRVVDSADRLIANTEDEAHQLRTLYDACPEQVQTVLPGVDLATFTPKTSGSARARLRLPADKAVLLFVGRIQPLKAPDVLIRAAATMLEREPRLRDRLLIAVVGGPSGSGRARPDELVRLAERLGVADVVRFEPPCPQQELADWYRAADVTVVPSYSESFGLVAVESQACGTPVVAAEVGGLPTAVRDGESGVLVRGHDPADYARVLLGLLDAPRRLRRMSRAAVRHGAAFGWQATVDRLIEIYTEAVGERAMAASA
jgi:D-inositol-3-phosphate glycosyltransferase